VPYRQFDYTGATMGEQRFDLGIFYELDNNDTAGNDPMKSTYLVIPYFFLSSLSISLLKLNSFYFYFKPILKML
jgi:hypothetical protein